MTTTRSGWLRAATLIAALWGALGSIGSGAPRPEAREAREDRDAPSSPSPIGAAIAKRIRGRAPLDDVRVDVEWPVDGRLTSARVYGNGVGIWDRSSQFRLPKTQVLAILKALQAGKFGSMPERFGESEGDERNEGPRLKGRISVRVGSISKTVIQLMEGEQSSEFGALAQRLLGICRVSARTGVGATGLADGLEKVAAGSLAPEAFQATVQWRADQAAGGGGWILQVEGRRILDEVLPGGKAPPPPQKVLILPEADFESLLKRVSERHPHAIPINVYSPEYTDLHLSVLRSTRSISGRRFLGMTPETKGEFQKDFDDIYEAFRALHERVRAEGTTVLETHP